MESGRFVRINLGGGVGVWGGVGMEGVWGVWGVGGWRGWGGGGLGCASVYYQMFLSNSMQNKWSIISYALRLI